MFDQLIGNPHAKTLLKTLIRTDRVPNSLLFSGIESVGKKQFALQLAKSFLCRSPNSGEACDECVACRQADAIDLPKPDDKSAHQKVVFTDHPDLALVLPYNRYILVDAIRDLEREANFRPFSASRRFFIIDDADMMNEAASGALLKTLEEPPETSFIILVTSRPDSLAGTIRSRCVNVRLAPIETGEIERHLVEKRAFSQADAALLAKLARGSVGHALESDPESFRMSRELMLSVLEAILLKNERAELFRISEKMSDAGEKDEYENRLDVLQTLIHDVWSVRLGSAAENIVNADIAASIGRLAAVANRGRLAAWLSEIEVLRENLNFNLNRKIATDALFVKMAAA